MTGAREKRIKREAAQWVVKFDGVDFNANDVRVFRRWLARSDEHRAAFQSASKTWNDLDLLARLENAPLPEPATVALDRRALIGAAAVGALALGAGGYALLSGGPAIAYETGVGEVREIALSDGTHVLLNAQTRIEAHIQRERRTVRVIQGEALFVIADNDRGLFSITTSQGGVEALGGEVLVKMLPEGARISLLSRPANTWRAGLISRTESEIAAPRSEIEFRASTSQVSLAAPPRLSRRLLWRDGRLAFDDTPLAEAVADVSRQTGARFVFADPALRARRVGGLIDARDIDSFLLLLRENLSIETRRLDNGAIELQSAD